MERQQPEMNNSYGDKMVHQLPSAFIAQLYSVLLVVKRMHDWGDGCDIKVSFHETEMARCRGFYFLHAIKFVCACVCIYCMSSACTHSTICELSNEHRLNYHCFITDGGFYSLFIRVVHGSPLSSGTRNPCNVKGHM